MIINSSSDSKYFSRLLNLYFSLAYNFKVEFRFKVWDLGMTNFQVKVLGYFDIEVVKIPPFVPHWNLCYSWKPYIYKYSEEAIFLYFDAGCTINGDLSKIYDLIQKNGYFFVNQGQKLKDIIPTEFSKFNFLTDSNQDSTVFAAGIIGINKESLLNRKIIETIFELAKEGYCLGFSKNEKNRDFTNLNIVRNCSSFRHDQSIVNAVFRKYLDQIEVQDANIYASTTLTPDCVIYNNRKLSYYYFLKNISFLKFLLFFYCYFFDILNTILFQIKKINSKYIRNAN